MIKDRLTKLSKREKTVLIVSVIAVLMAVTDRLVINPLVEKLKVFETDIQTTEDAIFKNMRIIAQRERIEQEEKRYAAISVQDRSEEEQTAALLREIENLASATTVYIADLKPSGIEVQGTVKKFAVSVNCEGEMVQLLKFFHALEQSDSLIRIAAFSLTPKGRQSEIVSADVLLYKIVVL